MNKDKVKEYIEQAMDNMGIMKVLKVRSKLTKLIDTYTKLQLN